MTVDVDLDHLPKVTRSVRFLPWKVTLCPRRPIPTPFHAALSEGHCAQPALKNWELCSLSVRMEYLHIWNSEWEISLFSPFLFHLSYFRLRPNIPLFILLIEVFQVWPSGAPSVAPMPLDTPQPGCVCGVWLLKHFLTFWHHVMLQAHPVYVLPRSQHRPLLHGSFYWRMVLETKIWVPGVLISTQYHCF